jgi:hypothetical protein
MSEKKPERAYKHKQLADRTKDQFGRKCITCGKSGTQIAHDIHGRERWHQVDEDGTEFVCHTCLHKEVLSAFPKN